MTIPSPVSFSVLAEAKAILNPDDYNYFFNLLSDYKISKGSIYWDVACFLTILRLKGAKSDTYNAWIEYWVKHSERERNYKHIKYSIPGSYIALINSAKDMRHYFYSLLDDKKRGRLLKWGEYINILYYIISELKPIFTKKEFSVFQAILDSQTDSNSIIAEKTGIRISNISRYKKSILYSTIYRGYRINKAKLNIGLHLVIAVSSLSSGSIRHLFPKTPFLRAIYESFSGSTITQAFFLVPNQNKPLKDLKAFVKSLNKKTFIYEVHELQFISEESVSFNYSSYKCSKGEWLFTPKLIKLFAHNNPFNAEEEHYIHSFFENVSNSPIRLNELQKQLINYIWSQDPRSIRTLASEFKTVISGRIRGKLTLTKIKRYINYLKKEGLLTEKYVPYISFGLVNVTVLLRLPFRYCKNIHNFLAEFPEVYSHPCLQNNDEYLYFIVRTPKENLLKTIELITHHFREYIEVLTPVDKMFRSKKDLPLDNYDPLYNSWNYTKGELLRGINVE